MNKWSVQSIAILMVFVLSGCTFGFDKTKPEEKIYQHLEQAAKLEQKITDSQTSLVGKEKKEQDLYKKIIQLNMSDFSQIVKLSKQAAKLANDREALMKEEKKNWDAAYNEFSKAKPIIKNLKDKKRQEKANRVAQWMDKRRQMYKTMVQDYLASIKLDEHFYRLFQKRDLKQDVLQKQVSRINQKYKAIHQEKEKFNQFTKNYNKVKKDFYKATDLDVTFEDKK